MNPKPILSQKLNQLLSAQKCKIAKDGNNSYSKLQNFVNESSTTKYDSFKDLSNGNSNLNLDNQHLGGRNSHTHLKHKEDFNEELSAFLPTESSKIILDIKRKSIDSIGNRQETERLDSLMLLKFDEQVDIKTLLTEQNTDHVDDNNFFIKSPTFIDRKLRLDTFEQQDFDTEIIANSTIQNPSPRIKISEILGNKSNHNVNFMMSPRNNTTAHYKLNRTPIKNKSPHMKELPVTNSKTLNSIISSPRTRSENFGDSQIRLKCQKHKDNEINSICIKDCCGELLCPFCIIQHTKSKHLGIYKKIFDFLPVFKTEIETNQKCYKETLGRLFKHSEFLKSSNIKENSVTVLLNIVEDNIIKNVRKYFDDLRSEAMDYPGNNIQNLVFDVESYRTKMESSLKELDKDLISWNHMNKENLFSISNAFRRNHIAGLKEVEKKIQDFDERMKDLKETLNLYKMSKHNQNLYLIDPNLEIKLQDFLNEVVNKSYQMDQNDSKKSLHTIEEKLSEQQSISSVAKDISISPSKNEDIFNYYQNLYLNEETIQKTEQKKTLPKKKSSKKGFEDSSIINSKIVQYPKVDPKKQVPSRRESLIHSGYDIKRAKTISPAKDPKITNENSYNGLEKISKGISHKYINTNLNMNYSSSENFTLPFDKDLDPQKMRVALLALSDYSKSQKIKIFDHTFLPCLLNLDDIKNADELENANLLYENIRELMTLRNAKYKSLFQTYEKLFFPVHIVGQMWILVEIKTNPKTVIIYDCINRSMIKNKLVEILFNIFQDLIKADYKDKFNQILDFGNQWERRTSFNPSLVVKNLYDTGIVVVKIISNALQHKDFTNSNIGAKEICIVRKKIERFFKFREDSHQAEKCLPF